MNLDRSNLEDVLRALDRQIDAAGGAPVGLVVCGGTALAALRLVLRTTKDVDILAAARQTRTGVQVEPISALPDWLVAAAAKVERDFALPPGWLNLGPAAQTAMGLPNGLARRLERRDYGRFLTIFYISRVDQVFFKLYATVDQGGYHAQDLLALRPSEGEIRAAVKWVLTQDTSPVFRVTLKDFLEKHGFPGVAEEL